MDQLIRYYIRSLSMGYYNIDKHMFFKQPSLPDNSSFHDNDYGFVCGHFSTLQPKYPDVEIIQVEIPVKVQRIK